MPGSVLDAVPTLCPRSRHPHPQTTQQECSPRYVGGDTETQGASPPFSLCSPAACSAQGLLPASGCRTPGTGLLSFRPSQQPLRELHWFAGLSQGCGRPSACGGGDNAEAGEVSRGLWPFISHLPRALSPAAADHCDAFPGCAAHRGCRLRPQRATPAAPDFYSHK